MQKNTRNQQENMQTPFDSALEQLKLLKQELAIDSQNMTEPIYKSPENDHNLSVAIDVGNGKEEVIEVCKGDNPDLLASMFCVRHGLNERQRVKLAKIIEKNMQEANLLEADIEKPIKAELVRRASVNPKIQEKDELTEKVSKKNVEFEEWERNIESNLKMIKKGVNTPKINPMSERIIASKNRGPQPAYLRLYKQALDKQKSLKSKLNQSDIISLHPYSQPKIKHYESSKTLNFGERIYERTKREREEKEMFLTRKKAEKEQKELKNATFKPSLNPRSKQLIRSYSSSRPEERLIKSGQILDQRLENQRNALVIQEKLECPFRPKINPQSENIARRAYSTTHADARERKNMDFTRLFEDSKRRIQEREKLFISKAKNECTFKPNTTFTKDYIRISPTNKNVIERLTIDKRLTNFKHYEDLNEIKIEYKPKTGRAPKNIRNSAGLPIGDYLYSQSKVKQENYEKIRKLENEKYKKSSNSAIIKEESRKLVENMKNLSFQKIFELLDSDEDGIITAKDVDITSILIKIC